MSALDLEETTTTAAGMRKLADVPFERHVFRAACEQLGVLQDPESDGNPMWEYTLPNGGTLHQGNDDDENAPVEYAMVFLYAFAEPEPEDHDSMESFLSARQEFDDDYATALAAAQTAAGPPLQSGIVEEDHLAWALWRGETGLFAVFQSYMDPSTGMELIYWVSPWAGAAPDPQPDDDFPEWMP